MLSKSMKIAAALSYINTILTIVVAIVITPLLIKSLGVHEYGLYSLIGGVLILVSAFDFGLSGSLTRFVVKYRTEENTEKMYQTINTVQSIFFVIYIFIFIFGCAFVLLNKNSQIFSLSLIDSEKALILIAILVPTIPVIMQTALYTAICNGCEHFIFSRSAQLVKYVFRTIIILWIISLHCDSVALVAVDMLVSCLVLFSSSYYVKKCLKITTHLISPQKNILLDLVKYSFWMFIYALSLQFFWLLGQFAVAKRMSLTDVSMYSICVMLGTYYSVLVTAYSSMFMSKAMLYTVKDVSSEELCNACINFSAMNTKILLFVLGGFVVVGKIFLFLWLGNSFNYAQIDVIWLGTLLIMLGYLMPLSQIFFNQLLEARGFIKYKAMLYICNLPIAGVINFFVIAGNGVEDFIFVILVCWTFSNIVMNFIYYKIFNIDMVYFFKKVYFIRGWQAFISVLMTLIIFSGYSLTVSYFFKIGLSYLFFWMILQLLIQYANKHKMRGAI